MLAIEDALNLGAEPEAAGGAAHASAPGVRRARAGARPHAEGADA